MDKTQSSATSGAESDTSGSENDNLKTPSTGGSDEVAKLREANEKLKREKENYAKRARELESEREAAERQKLEESQQFKTLYEQEKSARITLEEQVTQSRVNAALRDELVKLGLLPEHLDIAFRLINRKDVVIDPETKTVVNADAIAKAFHTQHASLGFFRRTNTGVSHQAPQGGAPSGVDLSKLSYEEKLKLWKKHQGK